MSGESVEVTIEIKQLLLSKSLIELAMLLRFYGLINDLLMLQIVDMAYFDIYSFKWRVKGNRWNKFKLRGE